MSNIITVDCNKYKYNNTYTLEYQYMQFLDMQDVDLLKSFLSNTDYFIVVEKYGCALYKGSGEFSQMFYVGDYVIKTKSNNVFVVDKETFDRWACKNDESRCDTTHYIGLPDESDIDYNTFRCDNCGHHYVLYRESKVPKFCEECGCKISW